MKQFITDDAFRELFPSAQFGVVKVKNMNNSEEATKSKMGRIKSSLSAGCVQTSKYLVKDDVNDNKVIKVWAEAYKKFTTDENACASVVELLKTGHEKGSIESVNALVDIINSDSLIWALPISVFDTDKISGDLHLGVLDGDVCFYDDNGALSKAWTYKYEDKVKVTCESKNALLIINLIDPTRAMELKACLNTMAKQPVSYVGAECSSDVLDNEKYSCNI